MELDGCPVFDVGEYVTLFVRANGRSYCPIAGWDRGRFRIVGGTAVYDEDGQEVWKTSQGKLAFGPERSLDEVRFHQRGPDVFVEKERSPNQSEGPAKPLTPISGTRLTAAAFRSFLSALVSRLHTASELAALPAMPSADATKPFYVSEIRAVGQ
jgi:hypothetical protein